MPLSTPNQVTTIPKALMINLADYCKIDGVSDDSAGFTTAYKLAALQGKALYHPGGTLIKGNDTIPPAITPVAVVGDGPGISIIKLKNGANADLFSAQTNLINLAAAAQSGSLGNVGLFSFINITLDGNKANQTSGTSYPLRFYGYNFLLSNTEIKNGYSGGYLSDWNSSGFPSDGMESIIENVKIHDCNAIGFQMGGPHDSRLINVLSFNNVSHNFHIAPNAGGTLLSQCHPYHSNTGISACGFLIEAPSCQLVNCMAEGSDTCQLAILASQCSVIGGLVFGGGSYTGVGIQLGQVSGQTPYPGQIQQSAGVTTNVAANLTNINTQILNCTNGAINFWNEGQSTIIANIYQTSGNAIVSGRYPANSDTVIMNINGLISDHSLNTQGMFQLTSSNSAAFAINNAAGQAIFDIDGNGKVFSMVNGAQLYGYSDGYTTQKYSINADGNGSFTSKGNLSTGQSASEVATATSGTIATANIGVSRVAPAGNITGVILQAGTVEGQAVTVWNNSAFTITFAAVGTSNVADGVSAVIAANRKMDFTWNSVAAKWAHS